jgi:hypothetical protein
MRALLLLLTFTSAFALAQGQSQPGKPSRGGVTTSASSSSATGGATGQYVGPSRRCWQTYFKSGAIQNLAATTSFWPPPASSGLAYTGHDRATTSRLTYVPRGFCGVSAAANRLCTIASNQYVTVHAGGTYSMWFRWWYGPASATSTTYIGARMKPNGPSSDTDVACSGTAAGADITLTNGIYVRCGGAIGAMEVCTNNDDNTPTCADTPFQCNNIALYDITFTFTPPTTVAWRIQDLTTGLLYETTQSSDLPVFGTPMGFASSQCTGTTSGLPSQTISYVCVTTE